VTHKHARTHAHIHTPEHTNTIPSLDDFTKDRTKWSTTNRYAPPAFPPFRLPPSSLSLSLSLSLSWNTESKQPSKYFKLPLKATKERRSAHCLLLHALCWTSNKIDRNFQEENQKPPPKFALSARTQATTRRESSSQERAHSLFRQACAMESVYHLPLYPGTAGPRCHFATYYLPSLSYLPTMFFLSFGKID
jgi:hypothetical protein